MSHLSQDEILEFASGRHEAPEAERIYEHLGACDACAQRYEAIQRIRSDFEGSWHEFLAEVRARSEGLDPAAAAAGEERITSRLVLRGTLDGSRRLATAAWERLSGALREFREIEVGLRPAYAGVGNPSETGEAARLAERASALCAEGKDGEALAVLGEVSRLDRRVAGSATLELLSGERKVGEIVVDAGRRSVSVLIRHDRAGRATGVAILAPGGGSAPERSAELEPVEDACYSLAEFEGVPDGAFSLRLELTAS